MAKKRISGATHYYLRQSFDEGGRLKSRDLFYLGLDPRDYLVYPDDGPAFYFHEDIYDGLSEIGVPPENEELERVFFPFLDPETQRVIEGFSHQGKTRKDWEALREKVDRAERTRFHMFDKRRMHYLRFVEMDQSRIGKAPKKIYRDLLDKSRDEIEQYFMEKENILKPREKKTYPYVIFNVAGHFKSIISRKFPQVLDQEAVDGCFLEEVCRLNADEDFWADIGLQDWLNDYLVRYVCWFFDSEFGESRYMEDMIWEWMARRQRYRPPAPQKRMNDEEAVSIMGLANQSVAAMTVKQLTRQYWHMAQTYHPDKGGDHEDFIKLNRAFEQLLRRLKSGSGSRGRYR
ncbi:MAG: hypothetical protein KGY61_02020 [Desulfobacterales bacterium]|nr:hypothetical protein [Desulfobacterales bacterium]